MNRKELISEMAAASGLNNKQSEAALKAFVQVVTDSLLKGDKVQVTGFGSFEIRERGARTGSNPATGEPVEIKARKVPVFKAGKTLKDQF